MFIERISNSGFSTSAGNQVYNQSDYPSRRAANGDVLAVKATIRNVLGTKITGLRQSKNNAIGAISMIQTFDAAVSTITGKLTQMGQLANDVARGSTTYTETEQSQMQTQFNGLAAEINTIVGSTKHNGNKLLSSSGQTVSVSIGEGSTVQISPRDLSFDATGLDLTVGPGGAALTAVDTAMEQASGLRKYFDDRLKELITISTQLEFDYVNNLGAEPGAGDSILAIGEATAVMTQMITSDATLIDIQANVNSDVALWLLKT
ncbi:MAG: flagellin [Planctomycetota bacterium]|jgi:flagellin